MRPVLLIVCAAFLLNACGVQRPLIAPRDIPAYEAKRKKKQQDIRRYQEEEAQKKTSPAAYVAPEAPAPIPAPIPSAPAAAAAPSPPPPPVSGW